MRCSSYSPAGASKAPTGQNAITGALSGARLLGYSRYRDRPRGARFCRLSVFVRFGSAEQSPARVALQPQN